MRRQLLGLRPTAKVRLVIEHEDLAISGPRRQTQAVLGRRELYAVDAGLRLVAVDATPLRFGDLLPNFHEAVVAACRHKILEFWMGPSNLPARPKMCSVNVGIHIDQIRHALLIDLVPLHLGDPDVSLRIAGSDPCTKVIELSVIL